MATYVYSCPACGHTVTLRRRMADVRNPLPICESCGNDVEMEPQLQPACVTWGNGGPPTPRDLARRLNRGIPDHVPEGSLDDHVGQGYRELSRDERTGKSLPH